MYNIFYCNFISYFYGLTINMGKLFWPSYADEERRRCREANQRKKRYENRNRLRDLINTTFKHHSKTNRFFGKMNRNVLATIEKMPEEEELVTGQMPHMIGEVLIDCHQLNKNTELLRNKLDNPPKYNEIEASIQLCNKDAKSDKETDLNLENMRPKQCPSDAHQMPKCLVLVKEFKKTPHIMLEPKHVEFNLTPPEYIEIDENKQLCNAAESKESKSIQCDCKHSMEELKRGLGCGEQCLNRQLRMECTSECLSGKYCGNKRFQRGDFAELETFHTGAKGWGVRAKKEIAKDQFIIEYLGEVIDAKEVQQRIKRYGQDPNHKHHYLMALCNGAMIDATMHGNQSRFINHSCEPNAVFQKWTVGKQSRIGFFAKRRINVAEEITINYKFGNRTQKCFCGTRSCVNYL